MPAECEIMDPMAALDEAARHGVFENVNLDRLAEPSLADILPLAEAKRMWEDAHPETRHGACGGRAGRRNESGSLSFSKLLATLDGFSRRTAERYCRIATRIAPEAARRILESDADALAGLARNRAQLLQLVRHDTDTQLRILDLIESGEAGCILDAEDILFPRRRPPKRERLIAATWRRLTSLERDVREAVLSRAVAEGWLDEVLERAGWRKVAPGDPGAPVCVLDQWLSAAELAHLRLPDLPWSAKGVRIFAERAGWRTTEDVRRGGRVTLYHIDDLPGPARRELMRRREIAAAARARVQPAAPRSVREAVIPTVTVWQDGDDEGEVGHA